ncbi:hypothetical protein PVK06_024699 [Gossypium arboreum]|uniref:Uncharacterized protein n=1 Tax=Gossypium arboreum TaxID=29729 RepID=A0ABR0PET3_GOSAR|nr:hypothetical protein PVK06_024699 [Gossypium arboreum]
MFGRQVTFRSYNSQLSHGLATDPCEYCRFVEMSKESRNVVEERINNSDHFIESENQVEIKAHDVDQAGAQPNRVDRPHQEGQSNEDLLYAIAEVL